jgi:hypothetical protein
MLARVPLGVPWPAPLPDDPQPTAQPQPHATATAHANNHAQSRTDADAVGVASAGQPSASGKEDSQSGGVGGATDALSTGHSNAPASLAGSTAAPVAPALTSKQIAMQGQWVDKLAGVGCAEQMAGRRAPTECSSLHSL